MRELVGGKNTIGRTAAVLKSPIKRPLPYLTCGQTWRVAFRNMRTRLQITYVISAEEASSKYEY